MSLTQTTLGERLRDARQNCGLTQEEAAEAVGIPRTALLHIESGKRALTSLELLRLSKLYRRDLNSILSDEGPVPDDPMLALCRVAPEIAGHPRVQQEIARYVAIFEEGVALERFLGRRVRGLPPTYDPPDPERREEAAEQGEAVAREERRRLNLGGRPIADMAELLGREEIWAAAAELPDELSGLFLSHPRIGLAVLVNERHYRGRRRFSYAHEYGHALMDRLRHPLTVTSRENSTALIERRANAFAAAFLMPAAGVREVLEGFGKGGRSRETFWVWDVTTERGEHFERRHAPGSQTIGYQDVAYLAHEFMVSYDAAAYRLSELDCISRSALDELLGLRPEGQKLIKLLRLRNPEAPDPDDQPRLTQEIGRLAVEAFRREVISGGRLLDICEKLEITHGEELLELARATQG
jgi:Zn-dependent peptidase ImmA (M78 family)/transcriptional regulator with XRE-family HTH domain